SGRREASTSLSTICCGVGPSGLPMDISMMSSPRRRAAIFSSPVMLNTYGGRRSMREKFIMVVSEEEVNDRRFGRRCSATKHSNLSQSHVGDKQSISVYD